MKDTTFMCSGWWSCLIKNTNLKFPLLGSGKKGRQEQDNGHRERLERLFSILSQDLLLQFGMDFPQQLRQIVVITDFVLPFQSLILSQPSSLFFNLYFQSLLFRCSFLCNVTCGIWLVSSEALSTVKLMPLMRSQARDSESGPGTLGQYDAFHHTMPLADQVQEF